MIISGTIVTKNYETVHEYIRASVWEFYGKDTDYDLLEFEVRDVTEYTIERGMMGKADVYATARVYEVEWKAKV